MTLGVAKHTQQSDGHAPQDDILRLCGFVNLRLKPRDVANIFDDFKYANLRIGVFRIPLVAQVLVESGQAIGNLAGQFFALWGIERIALQPEWLEGTV